MKYVWSLIFIALLPSPWVASASLPAAGSEPKAGETSRNPTPTIAETKAAAPETIWDAISGGAVSLNVRARYEHVDIESTPHDAHALTARTRLGYKTIPFNGLEAFIEAENIVAIADDYYDGVPPNTVGRPAVADPEVTEVNQAWLGYTVGEHVTTRIGRQRIVQDNARFIGDVGWRQDMQTFDAGLLEARVRNVELTYAYLWRINRIFGNDLDWDSDSHLLHGTYKGLPLGTVTAYSHILQFENSPAASTATFGAQFSGKAKASDQLDIAYRVEYAMQRNHRNNPVRYMARYHSVELGAHLPTFGVMAGHERLGSDNGQGFRTPLGTVHAFNGWADSVSPVLNGLPDGLRDAFLRVNAKLPGNVQLLAAYHYFETDYNSRKIGIEFDLQAVYRLNKHIAFLAKVAQFEGESQADIRKIWLQAEYTF